MPALLAAELHRSFGGVIALDRVSLSVAEGEVLAIVGPNGSGKTTFLNVVNGFYRPQNGEVSIAGVRPRHYSVRDLARLGVARTYQVPKLFLSLSVEEHLALAQQFRTPGRGHDMLGDHGLHVDLLSQVGLESPFQMPVRGMSHGQMRMLEVAMAVLRAPSVLLLDEPAAGLSEKDMHALGQAIRTISDEGVAVVIVEHHLDWVSAIADRVVVMAEGSVLWVGPPESVHLDEDVRSAFLGVSSGV